MNAILSRLLPWWPLAVCLGCFAAGWAANGWRWEAKEAVSLRREASARAEAQAAAALKDEANEKALADVRRQAGDHTRKAQAHAKDPDRDCPVPALLVRDHNAAAGDAAR